MRTRTVAIVGFCVLLSGCVEGNIQPNNSMTVSKNDAVVVIGVKENYRIGIQKGFDKDPVWNIDQMSILSANTFPENGYVVVRLPPRVGSEDYAISQVLPTGIGGPTYDVCPGNSVLTFHAPAGRLTYIGDVSFIIDGQGMRVEYSMDIEPAMSFVKKNFPAMQDSFESARAKTLEVGNVFCGPNINVIFVR